MQSDEKNIESSEATTIDEIDNTNLRRAFSIAVLACVSIYWFICLVTKSAGIDAYFLRDHSDTGMDYFNMLANVSHENPWYEGANYPAMCFAILRVMLHAVPSAVYADGIDGRGLRSNMIAQLGYILILVVCLVAVWELCQHLVQGTKGSKILFAASLLFSGPMFYLLERGNFLLISLPCLLAYYALYDSSEKKLRYVGYVCLALSASIELYPALFGLLVPMKKRYKETVHLLLIGIFVFFLPFFWFDGFDSVMDMLRGFGTAADVMSNHGVGYNFSVNSTLTLAAAMFGHRNVTWPAWVLIVPFAIGAWIVVAGDREWKKLYGIVLWCIWLPSFSSTYTLTLFFLPIISYFNDARNTGRFSKVYAVLFALLIIPYALPMMPAVDAVLDGEIWFPASWTLIIVDFAILFTGITVLIEHYTSRRSQDVRKRDIDIVKLIREKKKLVSEIVTQKSSKEKQYRYDREFWICGALLCVAVLAYHALYFNSVLPVSEGWGIYYIELLERGQFPYRDFAYYLPPFNLLIDWVFWKLSFGYLLAFRGWYLLQRLLIVVLLYRLMTKWFQPRYAWVACLTGTCLGSSSVYDLCGDYNQTQTLLCVLLAYLVSAFLEQDSTENDVNKFWNKCKYIFYCGILLAVMLLLKQSLGLAAVIVCFVFLVMYCTVFHDKGFGWYCAATAIGAIIPLLICCIIMALNGAFFPFLEQYFGAAAAKGGTGTIISSIIGLFSVEEIKLFCLEILLIFTGRKLLTQSGKYQKFVFFLLLCVFILSVHQAYRSQIFMSVQTLLDFTVLTVIYEALILFSVFFCVCDRFPRLKGLVEWNYTLPVTALFFAALACVVMNSGDAFAQFYFRSSLFNAATGLFQTSAQYAVIAFVAYYIFAYKSTGRYLFPEPVLALCLCALIDIYTCYMASSGSLIPRLMFTVAPIAVILLFSFKLPKWNSIKNYAVCLLCIFLCFLCMLQKFTGAYSWWGSSEEWRLNDRSETVEVEALAGFRLSRQMKLEYEQVVRIIEENGDEDSTVWGFPHVKIFNILTDHYNVNDPVPVLFYDVCSDEMAERETEWLRHSPPDFVIWCDIPNCLNVHEHLFRNGTRLGQRDIVEWFAATRSKKYTMVGQAGNLFVYQLKSIPVNYKYIQDSKAKNSTIGEY